MKNLQTKLRLIIRSLLNKLLRKFLYLFNRFSRLIIDQDTLLEKVNLENIVYCNEPSQCNVYEDVEVKAICHPLSILSEYENERNIYVDRTFVAYGMTLECLYNHYWFPESGFLISSEGKVWRHSTLGTYSDPDFLSTGVVERLNNKNSENILIFYKGLIFKPKVILDPYLITSHYASHNYGHFMLDMVPLIELGKKVGLNLISRPILEWHKSIYESLGVKDIKIVEDKVVFFKKVFVSNRHNALSTFAASPYLRETFDKLKNNISSLSINDKKIKKIYLSREGSKSRNLRNRKELVEALKGEGFIAVRSELLSFQEQVEMFSNVEIVIAEFGASLANVVFCKRNTKIVEIIPDQQNDPWSRHLCASMQLEHITLCQKVENSDREHIEFGGRKHNNIYFSYDADIPSIIDIIKNL